MKKACILPVTLFILLGLLITGCSNSSGDNSPGSGLNSQKEEPQFEAWLKEDAREAFNAAIDRDYRRMTVISGSLNKLRSSDHPELVLGTVLGATESTIFISESEYKRMDNNINLPAAVKKELAPAGLLNVLTKNYLVLEHTYRDVLKPYAEKVANKQALSVAQEKSLEKTIDLLLGITQYYRSLSEDRKNMSVEEVQLLVRELDKLQTQLGAVYFPVK